jgi:lipoprotein-anchoring transpeptidase ErfK/SrfK
MNKAKVGKTLLVADIALIATIVAVIFFQADQKTASEAEVISTMVQASEIPEVTVGTFTVQKAVTKKTEKIEIPTPPIRQYIEITEGCWPYLEAECAVAYSTPDMLYGYPMKQFRVGSVLEVGETIGNEQGTWYKVTFEHEWIRYGDRITSELYVPAKFVRLFEAPGTTSFPVSLVTTASSTLPNPDKLIIIDRSDQRLYAYEGDDLFTTETVSTGLNLTPTPRGTFRIFRKMPSRYMQGPLPGISEKYYDLPGVPWNLYFTAQGGAIHGAYWHDSFGQPWSSGCVNVPLDRMKRLYEWADLGTTVVVRD